MPGQSLIKTAEAGADLVSLVSKAALMLDNAKSSAEVLEAKALADVAYDAAKRASRLAKAQRAHHDITDAARRMQADSLRITARAQIRLADEIDAAQERGEIAVQGQNHHVSKGNMIAQNEIVSRKELHIARKLRDKEREDPGAVDRSIEAIFEADNVTKAAMVREVLSEPLPPKRKSGFKNPDYVKNETRDRALAFIGACEDLVKSAMPIEDILPYFEHWDIPRLEAAVPVAGQMLNALRDKRPELFEGAAA